MYYELALISVVIAAGYWGVYFARGVQARTYGLMLLGAAACAALGLYARKTDGAPALCGIAGAIGLGTAACLLVVGPLVRATARRFAASERFAIAQRLLDVADVLAPGSGVAEEKALLVAMREIRDGHIDQTIGALTAAKDRAPAEARLAIDERIAMLYLAAYRWDEAIAHAETHLFAIAVPALADVAPKPAIALRRALGVAPPVWVELLGAYGYKGDLDQAARMLARLEDVCAGRDDAAIWIHRGRMMFLALAGRVAAVEALVAPRAAKHMSRAARSYWYAVALDRHGDGRAARTAYEKARSQSRGRPRALIERALSRMPEATMIDVPPLASELVARVEAEAPPAVTVHAAPRGPWATRAIAVALLAWAGAIALFVGDSNDVGVVMRGGAMVRDFVAAGEWWRLVSAIFVHIGGLHLLVNAIGLWFLGRLCEELFGSVRMLAIFAVSGVVGAAASYLASPAGVSAGASGAVLGVLGAVFVEITLHRKLHRAAWRRGMWGGLAVVTVAQLIVDFMYPAIDQWAHAGGLVAGVLAGIALSPVAKWAKPARIAAIALGAAFGIATVAAAVLVALTPLAKSIGPADHPIEIGEISLRVPAGWTSESGAALVAPVVDGRFIVERAPDPLEVWITKMTEDAHRIYDQVDVATEKLVALPESWDGVELVMSRDDDDGSRQTWRRIVAGKSIEGGTILTWIDVPDGMARMVPSLFTQILASVVAVRPAAAR
ncbi:MAG TPA: rhomboid family intramembrane serine protease [Kofleriaceae bacterium]|jgi:membrane associated rhomboid family serine protease|nr:rhomboid family intramembrane serine protease [Kofleriaceae bacterium]